MKYAHLALNRWLFTMLVWATLTEIDWKWALDHGCPPKSNDWRIPLVKLLNQYPSVVKGGQKFLPSLQVGGLLVSTLATCCHPLHYKHNATIASNSTFSCQFSYIFTMGFQFNGILYSNMQAHITASPELHKCILWLIPPNRAAIAGRID